MFDNGLLKYYNKKYCIRGNLDISKLPIKEKEPITKRIDEVRIGNKFFFTKKYSKEDSDKVEHKINRFQKDSEILLGQLYTKFGLKSAIYTPAISEGHKISISNDVLVGKTEMARDYLLRTKSLSNLGYNSLLSRIVNDNKINKCFSPECIANHVKMQILDTASFNTDRHYSNFFFKMKEGRLLNINPKRAEDVISLDYEFSGENALDYLKQPDDIFMNTDLYFNDFTCNDDGITREDVLVEIENNKDIAKAIDKHQVGEELGALNPKEVAEDIYDTTGYKVSTELVYMLSKSYDEVADILCQS